jgi:hypothetical protein
MITVVMILYIVKPIEGLKNRNFLTRFGSKRESKTKSPKITRKGSTKSPKEKGSRISASSMQLCSSTFYDAGVRVIFCTSLLCGIIFKGKYFFNQAQIFHKAPATFRLLLDQIPLLIRLLVFHEGLNFTKVVGTVLNSLVPMEALNLIRRIQVGLSVSFLMVGPHLHFIRCRILTGLSEWHSLSFTSFYFTCKHLHLLFPVFSGNYSTPRKSSPKTPKGSSSPKAPVNDLRRVVSDKRGSKEQIAEAKRRSTLPNSNRSSTSSLNESAESPNRQSPTPPVKKPKIPTGKPSISPQTEKKAKPEVLPKRTGSGEFEGKKPVLPPKPPIPAKPPKPPVKPQNNPQGEKSNSLARKTLVSLANGLSNENLNNAGIRTSAEVTSGECVVSQQERPRVPPPRPSPETRVSRHKPSGTKLLEMIEQKLNEEGIDLVQEPYSNQVIFCLARFLESYLSRAINIKDIT